MIEIKNKILDLAKRTYTNISKVQTEVLAELLFYRLAISRLGEEDNNAWWESSILSETGRRNLNRFLPNTFEKQRYEIARKVVYNKETRYIDTRKFISLYNFGYEFETKTFKPFVDDLASNKEWVLILNEFEAKRGLKFSKPWVREFFAFDKLPVAVIKDEVAVDIGGIHETFYSDYSQFISAVKGFLSVYDNCIFGKLYIPYYNRKVAI